MCVRVWGCASLLSFKRCQCVSWACGATHTLAPFGGYQMLTAWGLERERQRRGVGAERYHHTLFSLPLPCSHQKMSLICFGSHPIDGKEREAKKWRSEKKVKWNTERGTPRRRAEWASPDMKRLASRCSNPGPFLWLLKPLAKVKATLSKLQPPPLPPPARKHTRKTSLRGKKTG